MTTRQTDGVTVTLFDREFKVKCPPEEVAGLHEAARYLDGKLREVHAGDKLFTLDRVAITAALNITFDLLVQRRQNQRYMDALHKQLLDLQEKIDKSLSEAI